MLYLYSTHDDLEVERLPEITSLKIKSKIKQEFIKSLTDLK